MKTKLSLEVLCASVHRDARTLDDESELGRHGGSVDLTVLFVGRRLSSTLGVEVLDLLGDGGVLGRVEPDFVPILSLGERSRDDVLLNEKRDVSDLRKGKGEARAR